MVKFIAVSLLVLIPILWGALMIPIMDYLESLLSNRLNRNTD